MSESDTSQPSECLENTEQNTLLEVAIKDTQKKDNALVETAELLSAVGQLTHDSYINTVKQAQSFVKFLHKQIKPTQEEGDS